MYPCDLLEVLTQFKHPRWNTIQVHADRWGARPREEVGIAPHGTIFVASAIDNVEFGGKHWLGPVPQDEVPRNTVKTAERDYDTGTWKGGDLLRGWRALLDDLVKQGHLYPCQEMSYLIDRNSYDVAERHWWLKSHPPPSGRFIK